MLLVVAVGQTPLAVLGVVARSTTHLQTEASPTQALVAVAVDLEQRLTTTRAAAVALVGTFKPSSPALRLPILTQSVRLEPLAQLARAEMPGQLAVLVL